MRFFTSLRYVQNDITILLGQGGALVGAEAPIKPPSIKNTVCHCHSERKRRISYFNRTTVLTKIAKSCYKSSIFVIFITSEHMS